MVHKVSLKIPNPLWIELKELGGSGYITAVMRTFQAREMPEYTGPKTKRRELDGVVRIVTWCAPPELRAMYQRKGCTFWLIPVLKKSISEGWVNSQILEFLQARRANA